MYRFNRNLSIAVTMTAALLMAGCGSSVKRVDINTEVAVSDRWNDTDSRLVSEEMVNDMLSFPWLREFELDSKTSRPTVIIQRVRNKSHEHIPVDTFVNDLKRSLIRSGRVDFVVAGDERGDIRAERRDQELNASAESQVEMGEESGANFALSGTINSIVDQEGRTRVTFYQVDLKLINMRSNREVWNGQKKLKKVREKGIF